MNRICQACSTSNAPDANFCVGCGAPLLLNNTSSWAGAKPGTLRCGACGHEGSAASRFCVKCGGPMKADSPAYPVRRRRSQWGMLLFLVAVGVLGAGAGVYVLQPEWSRTLFETLGLGEPRQASAGDNASQLPASTPAPSMPDAVKPSANVQVPATGNPTDTAVASRMPDGGPLVPDPPGPVSDRPDSTPSAVPVTIPNPVSGATSGTVPSAPARTGSADSPRAGVPGRVVDSKPVTVTPLPARSSPIPMPGEAGQPRSDASIPIAPPPPTPPAAAPTYAERMPPPESCDRYFNLRRRLCQDCAGLAGAARNGCEGRVRDAYCEGLWGKLDDCPAR